jgi:signal peptidase I
MTAQHDAGGPAIVGPRPFRLGREDLVALAGEVVGAGAALWVRAPGGSMLPTIPRGSLVRIDPVPSDGIEKGDVVLSLTAEGEPVIHRVVASAEGTLTTRGDAAIHTDPPVPFSRVIGIATAVRDATGERPITRRARRSMAVTVLKLRRRVARVVLGAR